MVRSTLTIREVTADLFDNSFVCEGNNSRGEKSSDEIKLIGRWVGPERLAQLGFKHALVDTQNIKSNILIVVTHRVLCFIIHTYICVYIYVCVYIYIYIYIYICVCVCVCVCVSMIYVCVCVSLALPVYLYILLSK